MNKFRITPQNPDVGLRPLSARSIILSVLLGSHPPEMHVAPLLNFTTLFGIANGTVRTALSRLHTAGELESSDGLYRLSGRLLDRQSQQDTGRAKPPNQWDGCWWTAVVLSESRSLAERRTFRSRVQGARLGELRPDTWMRPANIDVPHDLPDVALTRGKLVTGNAQDLVQFLWDLEALDREAADLYSRLEHVRESLDHTEPPGDSLASAFTVSAACLRYLRTEPQLPPDLATGTAANDLRTLYDETAQIFQERLTAFFRRSVSTTGR